MLEVRNSSIPHAQDVREAAGKRIAKSDLTEQTGKLALKLQSAPLRCSRFSTRVRKAAMSKRCSPIWIFVSGFLANSPLKTSARLRTARPRCMHRTPLQNSADRRSSLDLSQRFLRPLPVRSSNPDHARDRTGRPASHYDAELARANILASAGLLEGWLGSRGGRGRSQGHRSCGCTRREDAGRAASWGRDRCLSARGDSRGVHKSFYIFVPRVVC